MVDLDDLVILDGMLHNFVNRCKYLRDEEGIYIAIKNEKTDFDTINWFVGNFIPLNVAKLYNGFKHLEIVLNMKDCEIAVQAQNVTFDNGFKHKMTLWWYKSKDERDTTEITTTVNENCFDCIHYHDNVTYDSKNKLHDKGSKIGYLAPSKDVDSKGGIGYWKFAESKTVGEEPLEAIIRFYKKHEITLEQKEKLFGCSHAFEDGVPMSYRGSFFAYRQKTIKKSREIVTRLNGKIKNTNGHCKLYEPKEGKPNLNIYPVSYIVYRGMERPFKKFVFKGKLKDYAPVEVKA